MPRPVLLLAAISLLSPAAAQQPAPAPRPNVVLFYLDDFGWYDAGFQGSSYYSTPHMDRLASEGLVFTDAYADAPNCAPSRACLMTGRATPRHGIYTVGSAARGKARHRQLVPVTNTTVLAADETTLAADLAGAGYATWFLGKWHLGADPTTQGFEVNVGGTQAGHPKSYFAPYRNPALADGPEGEYLTDRLTDEALQLLAQRDERPFFLFLSHYAVHTPLQAPAARVAAWREVPGQQGQDNPKYAAMVEAADASLGRLLAALDELELAESTLVLLMSDNGGHGGVTGMGPLRGAKGMLYEGGVRVPLVARWSGRIAAGRRSGTPVIGRDLLPTLAALAGCDLEGRTLDGVDLSPLLLGGQEPAPRDLCWHFPAYLQATSRGGDPWRTTPAGSIRSGRWKLIEFFEDGRRELFDLEADPGESRDLAASDPERVAALGGRLASWRKALRAPVPTEREPRYVAPEDR